MKPSEDHLAVSPLLIWLVAQVVALAFAAGRVKLWAHADINAEVYALDEVILVQFLISTLLFPTLFRSVRATLALLLAALPMLCLAGYLASASMLQVIAVAINLAAWLFGLLMWRNVARAAGWELIAAAILTTANVAGVAIAYSSIEVHNTWPAWSIAVPVVAAIQLAHNAPLLAFSPSTLCLLLGGAVAAVSRVKLSTTIIP